MLVHRFLPESCLSKTLNRCLPQESLPQHTYMGMEGTLRIIFLSLPWLRSWELVHSLSHPCLPALARWNHHSLPHPLWGGLLHVSGVDTLGPLCMSHSVGGKTGHGEISPFSASPAWVALWHWVIDAWLWATVLSQYWNVCAASRFPSVTVFLVHSKCFKSLHIGLVRCFKHFSDQGAMGLWSETFKSWLAG